MQTITSKSSKDEIISAAVECIDSQAIALNDLRLQRKILAISLIVSLFFLSLWLTVFFLTSLSDYNHLDLSAIFDTVEAAESALDQLQWDAEERPSLTISDAIDQLREQLDAYYQAD